MSIVISKMLKKLRREKGFSQENLASFAGVTVQAVSKWENGVSCPDISLLPVLARIFDVSIDVLLLGTDSKQTADTVDLPDDNILRIVQARGNKILARQQSGDSWAMKLQMPDKENQPELKLEIWGSCSIEGDVNGNIQCGDGVNCGNVGGSIDAGGWSKLRKCRGKY